MDKSGNEWSDRNNFKKVPGKFFQIGTMSLHITPLTSIHHSSFNTDFHFSFLLLEIDYGGDEDEIKLLDVSKATGSKLDPRVQVIFLNQL